MNVFDFTTMPPHTLYTFFALLLTKMLGMFGIILGFIPEYRNTGGVMLVLSFLFITISIALSIIELNQQKKKEI